MPPLFFPSAPSALHVYTHRGRSLRQSRCTLRRAADFIEKAFTVIFLASMLIWFCRTFTPTLQPVNRFEHSILITAGKHLASLFAPLGFGSPETAAALLAGLGAKEAVISTLSILCREIADLFTPLSAFAFLTFVLLYMPCAAAFAAIKREIVFRFLFLLSFCLYQQTGGQQYPGTYA